jgi:hypothetical protein
LAQMVLDAEKIKSFGAGEGQLGVPNSQHETD